MSRGYMSRYSFQDSIRDKATLPLHFEAVDVKLRINKDAIDEAYAQMTDELSELDRRPGQAGRQDGGADQGPSAVKRHLPAHRQNTFRRKWSPTVSKPRW